YLLFLYYTNNFIKCRKLTIRKAIDFISDAWEEVSEVTIRNCWKATRIMPEMNEPEESESDDKIPEVNDATILVSDFSSETNLVAQELESNINKYIDMTKQLIVTEDILTDDEGYKISGTLDIGIGFDEYKLTATLVVSSWAFEPVI
ncbi:34849_t:CDS:2, partial [Gigaspora margarita]